MERRIRNTRRRGGLANGWRRTVSALSTTLLLASLTASPVRADEPEVSLQVTACLVAPIWSTPFQFVPLKCETQQGTHISMVAGLNSDSSIGTVAVVGSTESKNVRVDASLSGRMGERIIIDVQVLAKYDGRSYLPNFRITGRRDVAVDQNAGSYRDGVPDYTTIRSDGTYYDMWTGNPQLPYLVEFVAPPKTARSGGILQVGSTAREWLWDGMFSDLFGKRMELRGSMSADTSGLTSASYSFEYSLSYPFIDPIGSSPQPNVVDAVVTGDTATLAVNQNRVWGFPSDGATLMVMRTPAHAAGESVRFFSSWSGVTFESIPFDPDHPQRLTSLETTAVDTPAGPMAFAVVRAPPAQDLADQSFNFDGITADFNTGTAPLSFEHVWNMFHLRKPPVVLIHGLHGFPEAWDELKPLFIEKYGTDGHVHGPDGAWGRGKDGLFVRILDFSTEVQADEVSYPDGSVQLNKAIRQHSLGLDFNAPILLQEIQQKILPEYRERYNLAATQVDIVGHSMGGLIARRMVFESTFWLRRRNFGVGSIHRLITVDTPHLGAHQATRLMSGKNNCVAGSQTRNGWDIVREAVVDGRRVRGAVADLQGGEATGEYGPSAAIQRLFETATIPGRANILASFVTGEITDEFFGAIFETQGGLARIACGTRWTIVTGGPPGVLFGEPPPGAIVLRVGDDIANWYSAADWGRITNGLAADGIVSVVSQRGEAPDSAVTKFWGAHGPGTVRGPFFRRAPFSFGGFSTAHLGLTEPHILQPESGAPQEVVNLIDALDDEMFFKLY